MTDTHKTGHVRADMKATGSFTTLIMTEGTTTCLQLGTGTRGAF